MEKSDKTIQRELREIQKYVSAMNEIARRCDSKENIRYKNLQYEYHLQPIAIKALLNMGYLEKVSLGKYNWKSARPVTPFMARKLYDWMKEYFSSSKIRQREMLSEKIPYQEEDTLESFIGEDIEKKELTEVEINIEQIKKRRRMRKKAEPKSATTTKVIRVFGIPVISITTKSEGL